MQLTEPPNKEPFQDQNGLISRRWLLWFTSIFNITKTVPQSGTTAERPVKKFTGQQYYDTTLDQPIFVNAAGTGWVKADGTAA